MLDESKAKLDKTLAEAVTIEQEEELRRKIRQGGIYKPDHAAYLSAALEVRERARISASQSEQMDINRSAAAAARDAADAAREANKHAKAANRIALIALMLAIISIGVSVILPLIGGSPQR
jgi:hypothetical protein